jgi:hypothetical protein
MTMNETKLQNKLHFILKNTIDACNEAKYNDDASDVIDIIFEIADEVEDITRISTFKEAQVLTNDSGLILRMKDGSEFAITITRKR